MPNNRIVVECKNQTVLEVLNRLIKKVEPKGMRPVMKQIGENLTESTKQRFDSSTSPEGYPWKPLAEGTVLARLHHLMYDYHEYTRLKTGKIGQVRGGIKKSYQTKDGGLNKRGQEKLSTLTDKPLIDTGELKLKIRSQVTDGGAGVEVGTNRFVDEWEGGAAVHQFGTNRAGKHHNITIPARPFLGLSNGDKTMVLDILNKFIEEAAQLQK